MESDRKPPIKICHGPRCRDYGGQALLAELKTVAIDAEPGDCQSLCPYSPVVHLNGKFIPRATTQEIAKHVLPSITE